MHIKFKYIIFCICREFHDNMNATGTYCTELKRRQLALQREITETAFKHSQPVTVLCIFLGVYMLASVSTILLHFEHH